MIPGTKVRVLDPFSETFPGVYEVESSQSIEGGEVVFLTGIEPAFDPRYLEVVP